MIDARLQLARDGLAADRLEGILAADRYQATRPMTVQVPVAALRQAPDPGSEQVSQLLFGEAFEGLLEADGFVFGQSGRDGYVGFAALTDLRTGAACPTHRVRSLRTHAFSTPSIKSPPVGLYSLNSLVDGVETDGRFLRSRDGGWFVADHLAPLGQFDRDPVEIAMRFVGTPYLWGGNDSLGLDCSGLVQQALRACGVACPRDSDQQMSLGTAVDDPDDLLRGDLVFWRGHVGMICGEGLLLHANAHHMAVAVEPLSEAMSRIALTSTGQAIGFRRPI